MIRRSTQELLTQLMRCAELALRLLSRATAALGTHILNLPFASTDSVQKGFVPWLRLCRLG